MSISDIINYVLVLIVALPSLTIHEFAHGWAAYKFGDNTAKNMGRLTLNPIAHIDPFGTLLLPLIIKFGYAKPVPVNFSVLTRMQILLVAIAGPLSNFLLATILAVLYHIPQLQNIPIVSDFIRFGVFLNIAFMVFNLIPIPPLDGSRVVYASLKNPKAVQIYSHFSQFGMFIIIGLVFLSYTDRFDVFSKVIHPVIGFFFNLFRIPPFF